MQQVWSPVKKVTELTYGAFGPGAFGERAEAFARFFGTPKFLIGQSIFVVAWIVLNAIAITYRWDPYPFIALNLVFSLQAAYAAPLILLAQTRQADRDRIVFEADAAHREAIAQASVNNQAEIVAITAELRSAVAMNEALLGEIKVLLEDSPTSS